MEHEELHSELVEATKERGKVGDAAKAVAKLLHPHFVKEEEFALPALGLLRALTTQSLRPDTASVLPMTDRLKAELPQLLDEHKKVVAALANFAEAAGAQKELAYVRFAEKLILHLRTEEEVLYPAAILVGENLKLKTSRHDHHETERTQRTPVEMLEDEHRSIQKVVVAMSVLAEALEAGRKIDAELLRDIVAFMRTFADQCHHGKEETHLFAALERKGVPARGCPLAALIQEHQKGTALVSALAEAAAGHREGDESATEALVSALRALTALYPDHIWKEDYLLFPMANKILSPEEQADLRQRFEQVEETVGKDLHHRFDELAERLALEAQTL